MPTIHDCFATGRLAAASAQLWQMPYTKRGLIDLSYANTSSSAACHINLRLKSADSAEAALIGQDTALPASGTMQLTGVAVGPGDFFFGSSDGAVDFYVGGTLEDL